MTEDMHVGDAAHRSRAVAADLSEIFADSRPAAVGAGDSAVRRLAPRTGSRFKPATIGALLAAGLVGVSAGALLARDAQPAAKAPEPAIAAVTAPIPSPVPVPVPQPAAPVIQAAATEPPPTVEKAVEVKAKPKLKPKKVKARPARASRADVLAADRRLRRAYDRAIRAGVPRPVLVDYRNRWNRLRRTTWDEPTQLVRGYDRLERGLSAEAGRFS